MANFETQIWLSLSKFKSQNPTAKSLLISGTKYQSISAGQTLSKPEDKDSFYTALETNRHSSKNDLKLNGTVM